MRWMAVLGGLSFLLALPAGAQEVAAPPPLPPPLPPKEEAPRRWTPFLSLGLTTSLASASNVVGKPDGTTFSLGFKLDARLEYKRGPHEWRTSLQYELQTTRTPLIDEFVKSLDQLRFETIYELKPLSWLGVFVAASVEASLLPGEDVRPDDVTYTITEPDGSKTTAQANRYELTLAFSPLLLTQSTGLVFKFLDRKEGRVSLRAGVAFAEAFVQDALIVTSAKGTDVQLKRLEDFTEIGAQLRFDAGGIINQWLHYGFYADFVFPFYSSRDLGISELDATVIDISLKLKMKLTQWFSLDYVLGVRRMPLLEPDFQIWNGLVASFTLEIVNGNKPKAP